MMRSILALLLAAVAVEGFVNSRLLARHSIGLFSSTKFPAPESLDVYVTDVVHSPIEKVWSLFRPFGSDVKKWWHIYDSMEIISPSSHKDEVGAVRKFKLSKYKNGTTFEEKLVERDDQDFYEEYDYVASEPKIPGFDCKTFVKFTPNTNGTTTVQWGSKSKFPSEASKATLSATQHAAYSDAIYYLNLHLNTADVTAEPLSFLGGVKDTVEGVIDEVITTPDTGIWEYEKYGAYQKYFDVPMYDLPRKLKGLPKSQVLNTDRFGKGGKRFAQFAFAEIGLFPRLKQFAKDPFAAFSAFQDGENLPKTPGPIQTWNLDSAAAQHFVKGLSPMTIRLVQRAEDIPPAYEQALGASTLAQYIKQKKLFFVDYPELKGLYPYKGMFFYPASGLILNNGGKDGADLDLLAIQLSDDFPVYVKGKTPPNRWTLAKLHLKLADNQVMQFVWHLGYSHFALEAFSIASHNAFMAKTKDQSDHPLWLLLKPHFRDTIGINYVARQTLVSSKKAFTDDTFAIGTPQALQVVAKAWKKWDFAKSSFPNQLLERGFDEAKTDGLEGFYYREDGFRLWHIFGNYVRSYVDEIYASDADVSKDAGIKTWVDELTNPDKANVHTFPKEITTKKALVDVLQSIIWKTSAGHAVLNFAQYQVGSFTPNAPICLMQEMPPGNDEIPIETVVKALPDLQTPSGLLKAGFQVSFSHFLTEPSDFNLYGPKSIAPLAEKYPDIHEKFQTELKLLSLDIKVRNKKAVQTGAPQYPFLDPEFIPASVDI